MYSKNLYLIITNYSKMLVHLRQRNHVSVSSVLDSKKKIPFVLKVLVPGGKIMLSVDKYLT